MADEEIKKYAVDTGGSFKFRYKTTAKNKENAQEQAHGFLSWLEGICNDAGHILDFESLDWDAYEW